MTKHLPLSKILLIDDDEAITFVHTLVIDSLNMNIQTDRCYNGQQGIEYLTKNHDQDVDQPGIVFVDINMPVMNGFEFLDAFAEIPFDTSNISVIAMLTTSLNPDDEIRARSNPLLADFIQKPLSIKNLKAILADHFVEKT